MRVLFFLRNFSGYFRQFEPLLTELLERGHEVHIGRDREDDMRGKEWARALRERYDGLTWDFTPFARTDPWYDLKRQLRLTADYAQFLTNGHHKSSELALRARKRAPALVVTAAERRGSPLRRPGVAHVASRAIRAMEDATPTSRALHRYILDKDPDVVLLTPHLMPGSLQTEYLRGAMALGIPTALCVASWDNLSSKQLIRVVPDAVTVWNDTQKREAVDIHGLPGDRIAVTGAQVYDHWFDWPTRPREEFCARVGLRPDRPYVLYIAGALFPAEITEAEWVETWLEALGASPHPELREASVLVRPHPKRFAEWEAADLGCFGRVALWPREGRVPVETVAKQDFYDSIAHSAGVVGINTSAMIEAGIAGRRVHTLLVPEFAASQLGTLHFRYLTEVGGGLLRVAHDMDEHLRQLADSVAHGGIAHDANRAFIEAFVRPQGLDRAATPVFADTIERVARRGRGGRSRAGADELVVRAVLQPVRLVMKWRGDVKLRRSERRRRAAGKDVGYPGRTVPKTKTQSPMHRATLRLRNGSDRERSLYVTVRKALAPRITAHRSRAARTAGDAANGVAIAPNKGYAIFPPGTFPEAAELVADAQARVERIGGPRAVVREGKGKEFLIPLLAAVSGYLGTAPLLTSLNVYVSKASDRGPASSQLFHCDADDTAQIKAFVLCGDVTEANGPLMILDAERSRTLRQKVRYTYRRRVTDEEAQAALGEDLEPVPIVGDAGTVCLVDTSRCFHYGSRVDLEAEPRVVAITQYLTPHSFMLPRDATDGAPYRNLARDDDGSLARLALGA